MSSLRKPPYVVDSEWEYENFSDKSVQLGRGFSSTLFGEKGLWLSVLHRAIEDLSEGKEDIRRDAVRFFVSKSGSPFSFLELCDLLELSSSAILSYLKAKNLLTFKKKVEKSPAPQRKK